MNTILALHNLNRWIVLLLLLITLVRAYLGWRQNRDWTSQDDRLRLFTTIALDVQLLFGLLLYFTSPITSQAFEDFGAAMRDDTARLFVLEHPFYSLLAIAAAHMGSSRVKKAQQALSKYRTQAIVFTIVLILLILAIPWQRSLIPHL